MKTDKIFLVLMSFVVFTSCIIVDDDVFYNPPECKVISSTGVRLSPYGGAEMSFTIRNTGSGSAAYDVNVQVWLKDGGYVVDEGIAFIYELEAWETRTITVYFDYIECDCDYNRIESKLSWYDQDGYYYD